MMTDLKPCPFCLSENLRTVDMLLATDDGEEEIDVIECLDCDAQARIEFWNKRPEETGPKWQEQITDDNPAPLAGLEE